MKTIIVSVAVNLKRNTATFYGWQGTDPVCRTHRMYPADLRRIEQAAKAKQLVAVDLGRRTTLHSREG